jgi:hypothetical protein
MLKHLVGVLAATFLILAPAWAQQRPTVISAPSKKAELLKEGNQYAFEVRCIPRGDLQDPSDFFNSRNRSLFVLIAPNAPSTTDKLPSDALAALQVYTIGRDKDTKQTIISDDRSCSKDFLVNGNKKVGIVVTDNWMNNFSDSVFGQVFSGTLSLMSPLFSLFTGGALPALIAGNITKIGNVQTNVQNMLTALNRGLNYTHPPLRQLRIGKYVIRSDYATVNITVRAVPSIVLDRNAAFKEDLRSQVAAANIKLDPAKIDTSCRGGRFDISQLGFKSNIDLAYGLTQLAAHAGFSIKDSVSCLTPEYAKVAAAADERFWGNFPKEFIIAAKDLPALPSNPQPSWDSVKTTLDQLVLALARYARNMPPLDSSIATLSKLLAPQLTIIDNTTSIAIGEKIPPAPRFDAIKRLTDKGYIRFGCYGPTDNTTDQSLDGATSMFLVFKASSDATRTTLDAALAVRPQFTDAALSTMAISDNRAWITATLKARGYDCNGFSVDKPATAMNTPP